MITTTTTVSLLYRSLYFDFSGKKAFFKAMVSGEPVPTVTWGRNKGTVDEPKYQTRYDERTQEHILEVRERYLNKTLHISLKKKKKEKRLYHTNNTIHSPILLHFLICMKYVLLE